MEILYHIFRHILWRIFPYIGLIYGRYLQFRILKWPLNLVRRFMGMGGNGLASGND